MNAHRFRGIFWLALATLSVFIMASSSPQCAQTNDQALAPGFETLAANTCVQDCIDAFQEAKLEQRAWFRAAREDCNNDSDCLSEVAWINSQIIDELVYDKDMCIEACDHDQGTATGGQ
jgi:hypothetical protein